MIPEAYVSTVLDLLPMTKQPVWCKLNGHSMEPVLCHDDALLVQPGNRGIRIGDIIVFKSHQQQCAHRVVGTTQAQGQRAYLTKGDNRYSFDPAVPAKLVLGKVITASGADGTMNLNSIPWRVRNILIAVYSRMEGRRYSSDAAAWKLLDRFLTWTQNLCGLRDFHRSDIYRRIAARK